VRELCRRLRPWLYRFWGASRSAEVRSALLRLRAKFHLPSCQVNGKHCGHHMRLDTREGVQPQRGNYGMVRDPSLRSLTKRLGIPGVFHEECLHGHAAIAGTSFPRPIAVGATFNPQLVESLFSLRAEEARLRGTHQARTPVVDVARDARWGRVEETYVENPYLAWYAPGPRASMPSATAASDQRSQK
jgi:hypothetical protein